LRRSIGPGRDRDGPLEDIAQDIPPKYLRRCSVCHDFPAVEQHDAVGESAGQIQIVSDHEPGQPIRNQHADQLEHFHSVAHIE